MTPKNGPKEKYLKGKLARRVRKMRNFLKMKGEFRKRKTKKVEKNIFLTKKF